MKSEGYVIVAGDENGRLLYVSFGTNNDDEVHVVKAHSSSITCGEFFSCLMGVFLVTGSEDGSVVLWELMKGKNGERIKFVQNLLQEDEGITCISLYQEGDKHKDFVDILVSSQSESTWVIKLGKKKLSSQKEEENCLDILDREKLPHVHSAPVEAAIFLSGSNGSNVASCSLDCKIVFYGKLDMECTTKNKFQIEKIVSQPAGITKIIEVNGFVFTGDLDGTIRRYDDKGRLLSQADAHEDVILSLSHSNDGIYLASSSKDASVRLWLIQV